MARSKIKVGNISDIDGEVNIAAGDIIKNVKTIHQRALTAAEEAARARKLESKLLAQGIATLVQNLSAQASEGTESDSPYKGLLPYGLNEAEIFYGRNKAKKDLLAHIKQNPLTVLHAESGAGKSSLLQAGIAAQLIANGHLAVYLRPRDADPVDFIKRMFVPELTQAPAVAKAALREFLKQVGAVLGGKTTLYLLLDQFEEFFNLLDKNEREPFLESLADCLSDPSLKVRWVLALRAEALSKLAELETVGIAPFKNMYSLHRLSRAEAQEAIIEPARRHGIVFEPALIDHILNTLTTNGEVTPTHLQLVCSALTDDLPVDQTLTLTYYIDHEGDTEGILRDYLKRQLDHLPVEEQAPAWKVLRALITADRLRDLKTYDELVEELKLSGVSKEQIDLVLARLVERRLLATQPAATETFELAHDYLVKEIELDPQEQARKAAQELLIQETRTYHRHRTLLSPERLAVIEPHQSELRLSADAEVLLSESRKAVQEEQRLRERRRNITLGISVAVAVVMTLLAVWGFRSSGEASKQAEEAEKQANIALARQLAAQAQSVIAAGTSNQMIGILLAAESMQIYPSSEAAQLLLNNNFAGRLVASMIHGDIITSVAFSPDGKYVASSSYWEGIRVWETATGKEVAHKTYDLNINTKSVAFSPDGRFILSVGCEGLDVNTLSCRGSTILIWEVATGKEVARIENIKEVNTVAFDPDGRYIVSSGCDEVDTDGVCKKGAVHIWEPYTGQEVASLIHGMYVKAVAFSPDDRFIVAGGCDEIDTDGICKKGTVRVWEAANGEEIAHMTHDEGVTSVAFSPDGKYVASSSHDGTTRVWNVATGKEVSRFNHNGRGEFVAFSPDGKYVISRQSYDNSVWVSDASTGNEISHMTHDFAVTSVAFSPDGNYVISGSEDGTARVWKAATGEEVTRMTHDFAVTSVAFSSDGRHVASGDDDGTVRVWEALTRDEIAPMAHKVNVTSVAFSPDGRYIVSGGCDERNIDMPNQPCNKGTVRVWDAATGKEVSRMIHDSEVIAVAFSPDGKNVVSGAYNDNPVSGTYDATVRVWEAATGKEIKRMTFDGYAFSFALGPYGRYMVLGENDDTILVWEATAGKEVARLPKDSSYVLSVAFSPDGRSMVSGNNDGTVRIWEAITGKEVAHMTHNGNFVYSVAFSPDGKNVVSGGSDTTLRVWEVATGDEVAHMIHDQGVNAVAFSPDGKYVVSGSYDGTARVWEVATGNEVARMIYKITVTSVAFSPDGRYVVSAGCDETDFLGFCTKAYVRIWVWQAIDVISNACTLMPRNLTYDEWNKYIGDALPYQAVCTNLPLEPESTPTPTAIDIPTAIDFLTPTPFSTTLEVLPDLDDAMATQQATIAAIETRAAWTPTPPVEPDATPTPSPAP